MSTGEKTGILRRATWRTGFLMGIAVCALTLVSAGPLAQQVGPVSILVWTTSSFVGLLQVLIYSELAGMYQNETGGMTMCMGDAFDKWSHWPTTIAQWAYWYAWIPVMGIMPILMAQYLNQMIGTNFSPFIVGIVILGVLLAINYFGITVSERGQLIISAVSLLPLVVMIVVAFARGLVSMDNLLPFRPYGSWGNFSNPEGSWFSMMSWVGIGAAYYVASWGSYAFETITVYVGEYKNPVKDTVKAAWSSGTVVTILNTMITLALVGVLGVAAFADNPDYPFLKLSEAILGPVGGRVALFIIFTGLFLMANTAFNGTARILYGMSKEGTNLKQWMKLSPNGFPYVAAIFNIAFAIFLMTFEVPVKIIAASNLAYMICIFMPLFAFVILRKKRPDHPRPFKLPNFMVPVAFILGAFNVILILPGALYYGAEVMVTGSVITLLVIPLCLYRKKVQDKAETVIAKNPEEIDLD
ncbi:APC family permease [Phosphitispora fastidiosa]|uniref:APC family permease n=1 Tax=Phosphitispora fastidiosa TaxID=2837202 RepID=UPI001E4D0CA7|nr:APC family permease [Phosphitispora fastidiosa]MBU7007122.1 amino acid transporter [Phosphitispora fastidiosa]